MGESDAFEQADFSPDRGKVLYLLRGPSFSSPYGGGQLRMVPAAGGPVRSLAADVMSYRYTPDGTQVLVQTLGTPIPNGPPSPALRLIRLGDANSRLLSTSWASAMQFSPSREMVAVVASPYCGGSYPGGSLEVLRLADQERLAVVPSITQLVGFTPDGKEVLFFADERGCCPPGASLWALRVSDGSVRTLATGVAPYPIERSGDGTRLLFLADVSYGYPAPTGKLEVLRLTDGQIALVAEATALSDYRFSPEGDLVFFLSGGAYGPTPPDGPSGATLYVAPASGGSARTVGTGVTRYWFSHDGARVLFLSGSSYPPQGAAAD